MQLLQKLTTIVFLIAASLILATAPAHAQATDAAIHADVQKLLNKKQFASVQAAVSSGAVTLTGQVSLYADKQDAERRLHRDHDITAVNDQIQVAVPEGISDAELQEKLGKGLEYDRVGYGTTMFNSISFSVQHGVVSLYGVVYGPSDKESAMSLVSNTPGVRDIVDHLQVAPTSPNDDRIRRAEAQAIYGYPALNRYALNPVKPIRITVVDGHVTLTGMVDNKGDSDLANIRANGVSGVFSVQNQLQVEGAEK